MRAESEDFSAKVLDHCERLFGPPAGREVLEHHPSGTKIQVLEWANLFEGCRSYLTLGLGRLADNAGGPVTEVFFSADEPTLDLHRMVILSLLAAIESTIPLRPGISIGGLTKFGPKFSKATQKSCLYLCEPFPLPDEFQYPEGPNGRSRILLALPISTAEHEFNKRSSEGEFENLLADNDVDPFDVRRPSVV